MKAKYSIDCIVNVYSLLLGHSAVSDYQPTTQVLTFSGTTTQHSISISINDDDINEGPEQFFARLEFQNVDVDSTIALSPNTVVIRIIDNDGNICTGEM